MLNYTDIQRREWTPSGHNEKKRAAYFFANDGIIIKGPSNEHPPPFAVNKERKSREISRAKRLFVAKRWLKWAIGGIPP